MSTTLRLQMISSTDEDEYQKDIDHTVTLEDEYLPEMLYHMKTFLQGAGFNYVENLYAIKSDGEEVGEE